MRSARIVVQLLALILPAATVAASPVVINFDDRPGKPPGFGEGTPCPSQYFVNDEYSSLGVLFDSGGGGICIGASSNPVSPPNVASATKPGPKITYELPVEASFWLAGNPGVVDSVSITLTDSSSESSLEAFDLQNGSLSQVFGEFSETLTVEFPGQIHSVRIHQGPMAFDDFTFDGLVPEPSSVFLLLLGAGAFGRRRYRRTNT